MRSTHIKLPPSVWGQIKTLLFQPEIFFKALAASTSAWILIAVVLMLLTGLSEVRRQERLTAGDSGEVAVPVEVMPPMDGGLGMDPSMGGGVPLPPPDMGGGGTAAPTVPITQQLEQILGASGSILAMWLLLVPLLALVTLFNGQAPKLNRMIQVAVWATVPLGVLALLQLAYYGAGGKAGEPGVLGIVDELPFYASLGAPQQSLTLSAASRITLFHLWTVVLVWIGARQTLRGKKPVVLLVVAAWMALIVVVPVATGAYHVEPVLPDLETLPEGGSGDMPVEGCDPLMDALQGDNNPNILSDELIPFDNMPLATSEATADEGAPVQSLEHDSNPNILSDEQIPFDIMPDRTGEVSVEDCASAPGTTEDDLVTEDSEPVRPELAPTPIEEMQSQRTEGKPRK